MAISAIQGAHREDLGKSFRLEPIVDLITGKAIGHELLAGLWQCPAWKTEEWREWYGLLESLVPELLGKLDGLLFINTHGEQLLDTYIQRSLSMLKPQARRVVIEWTEYRFHSDRFVDVLCELNTLRGCGFQLAVDDIGAGSGVDGLGRAGAINPQFCKIDGTFFQRCRDQGPEYLRGICQHLALGGSRVVAEWVETEADYRLALAAGAHLGQGYFWSRGLQGLQPAGSQPAGLSGADIAEQGEG